MVTVILLIHLIIATALVAVVLLQRSEGGALGIGGSGGGGAGGFLTGRGTANFLTRVTAGLAAAFFLTSTVLSLLAQRGNAPASVFDTPAGQTSGAPAQSGGDQPATGRGGILDKLQPGGQPSVPQTR